MPSCQLRHSRDFTPALVKEIVVLQKLTCRLLIVSLFAFASAQDAWEEHSIKEAGVVMQRPIHHFTRRGKWSLAETVDLEETQQKLSGGVNLTMPYAKGMPEGCITYEDRYKDYKNLTGGFQHVNQDNIDSKYVILVRVHYKMQWSQDLILSLRALVTEVHIAGWHVWILSQDYIGSHSIPGTSPAHYIMKVPEEFRPLLVTFTGEQLHNMYPSAHVYRNEDVFEGFDYRKREYLGPAMFLRRYPAYKFAFIMEYDVRYIGQSWGHFFSTILNIGINAMVGAPSENTDPDMYNLPAEHVNLPDLILFSDDIHSPETLVEGANQIMEDSQWQFLDVLKEFTGIYGMSPKMNSMITRHSDKGSAGFIEEFLPTLAANEDIDVSIIPLGEWNNVFPLHCCSPEGPNSYDDWFLSGQCKAFRINHPVKNKDHTIWKNWYTGVHIANDFVG